MKLFYYNSKIPPQQTGLSLPPPLRSSQWFRANVQNLGRGRRRRLKTRLNLWFFPSRTNLGKRHLLQIRSSSESDDRQDAAWRCINNQKQKQITLQEHQLLWLSWKDPFDPVCMQHIGLCYKESLLTSISIHWWTCTQHACDGSSVLERTLLLASSNLGLWKRWGRCEQWREREWT